MYRPIAYAHRGFAPDGAENSLAAFQAAYDLGYRYLETDAHASRDGVVYAFHDERLDRLTNATGRFGSLQAAELDRVRILGQAPIARLADLLTSFPDAHFNVDVKHGSAIGPLLDVLRETRSFRRVRLATFSHRRLLILRAAAGPGVATALSPVELARLRLGRAPLREPVNGLGRHGPGTSRLEPFGYRDLAAQLPVGPPLFPIIDRQLLAAAHRRGIPVHAWTINSRAEMVRLLDLGVDGIMTDRADILRDVLMERGQWPG